MIASYGTLVPSGIGTPPFGVPECAGEAQNDIGNVGMPWAITGVLSTRRFEMIHPLLLPVASGDRPGRGAAPAAAPQARCAEEEPNLVTNPSFEEGNAGWTLPATHRGR